VNKLKKILYLFLFSLILITLFFNKPVSAYKNTKYGFTIDPPPMWELEENTGFDGMFIAFVNLDNETSINILIEEYVVGTLWDYVDEIKEGLAVYFDDYNLVYEESRVIGGLDCYELVYTLTDFDLELKCKQVVFVENGVGYVLTCGSLESNYSDQLMDFENAIISFRLTSDFGTSDSGTSQLNFDWITIGIIIFCLIVIILLLVYIFKIRK